MMHGDLYDCEQTIFYARAIVLVLSLSDGLAYCMFAVSKLRFLTHLYNLPCLFEQRFALHPVR